MKQTITILFIIASIICFSQNREGEISKITIDTNLYNYWILAKQKSNNENWQNFNTGAYSKLIFLSTGSYIRLSENGYDAGKYIIKDKFIGFLQTESDGIKKQFDNYIFRWEIIELNKMYLILRIKGRGGYEYYYYKPNIIQK